MPFNCTTKTSSLLNQLRTLKRATLREFVASGLQTLDLRAPSFEKKLLTPHAFAKPASLSVGRTVFRASLSAMGLSSLAKKLLQPHAFAKNATAATPKITRTALRAWMSAPGSSSL